MPDDNPNGIPLDGGEAARRGWYRNAMATGLPPEEWPRWLAEWDAAVAEMQKE